jgi:predicted nuclease with RNAse H fold
MLAAGIDLGGRTTGTTAIAWVEGAARPRVREVRADRSLRGDRGDFEIRRSLGSPGVVAIDAPLSLPHAVVCSDDGCPECFPDEERAPSYGMRPRLDSVAAWKDVEHVEKPPMPTVMIAGIAFRAIYLARLLRRAELDVIEVWPMGAYRALARTARPAHMAPDGSDDWRRALLEGALDGVSEAVPGGDGAERDRLDSIAAAYVGWLWLAGAARSVPPRAERDSEAIWIP